MPGQGYKAHKHDDGRNSDHQQGNHGQNLHRKGNRENINLRHSPGDLPFGHRDRQYRALDGNEMVRAISNMVVKPEETISA